MKIYLIYIALIAISFQMSANASLCSSWSAAEEIGVLDHNLINEASGLAISKRFAGRTYHINDSGDGPHIYISNLDGSDARKIVIKGFDATDVEDLSIGPCKDDKTCLFIGDIGDNAVARENIKLVIIEELEIFPDVVDPVSILTLKYPDGPHNAEGMAVHPNGDLFIITKEIDYLNRRAMPAAIYRMTWEQLGNDVDSIKTFAKSGTLDFPWMLYDYNLFGRIVTAFDIHPDGNKFIILTYQVVVEMNFDLSKGDPGSVREMQDGVDYKLISIPRLAQQEAISYLPGSYSFIYNTEFHESEGSARILRVNCN